jgi:hypothetical protein
MIAVKARTMSNIRQSGEATDLRPTCAVRLIDRRTGNTLRVNGTPLVALTHDPAAAVAELLEGRNPAVWEARVEVLVRPRP